VVGHEDGSTSPR